MFNKRFATVLSLSFLLCAAIATAQTTDLFLSTKPLPLPALRLDHAAAKAPMPLRDLIKTAPEKSRILIHLWAPFCPPCRPEMKALDQNLPALRARGYTIFIIAEDPDGEIAVPAFYQRYALKNSESWIDPAQTILKTIKGPGMPSTYEVDTQGRIIAKHEGPIDWENFTKLTAQE